MKIRPDRDRSLVDFIFGQLESIDGLRFRRMFGSYGLYADTIFFAIVWDGRLFFKTGDESRKRYLEAGMPVLQFHDGQKLGTYYQVPVDVIEDADSLEEWALEAIRAAGG